MHHARPKRTTAFTLVELMVSVALALLLLIGVNQVFKTTTDTVGTGYATSQIMRQQMAAERVFNSVFENAVPATEQPFILIHSQQQFGFMNRTDLNADRDYNPGTGAGIDTVDFNGNGTEGEPANVAIGEIVRPADYGPRSHRVDRVSFFARNINNPFRRATGDHTTTPPNGPIDLVANEYSPEAYVWLGHLRLPNNAATDPRPATAGHYYEPGFGTVSTNPNNFVVADWALGQQTILLKENPANNYIEATPLASATNTDQRLEPLGALSESGTQDPAFRWQVRYSRFDIAETSIADYRNRVAEVSDPAKGTPPYDKDWYLPLDYRFNAKPWITKPADPTASGYSQALNRETALTAPFLYRGCSQFIVEFAGDFLTQNPNNGNVTATKPDGVVDFIHIGTSPNDVRRTRWYGFPRDVAGPVGPTNPNGGPDRQIVPLYDVVPVRDVAGSVMPFEKDPNNTIPKPSGAGDYFANGALAAGARYICAWSPRELDPSQPDLYMPPAMIRVIVQSTDPQGRLGEGPISEFVYNFSR